MFTEGITHGVTLGCEERIGHAAADDDGGRGREIAEEREPA